MADGQTLSYVKSVEVIHPDLEKTFISVANLPKVCFTPQSTSEEWIASQEKRSRNIVIATMVLLYRQRESSIIGDSSRPGGQGKGIVDMVLDLISVLRGTRLAVDGTNYLHKPLDVSAIDYFGQETDDGHLLIAEMTLEAERLFLQTSLPGNIS